MISRPMGIQGLNWQQIKLILCKHVEDVTNRKWETNSYTFNRYVSGARRQKLELYVTQLLLLL